MNGYWAFFKKELLEAARTYKMLMLFALFFFFGILSPLIAKFMPEILSSMPMEGIEIIIPEPSKLDAYGQFFSNNTQMGVLGLLLLFGGLLSQDLSQGTILNMLTKGLGRSAVILAKFSAAALLWTLALLLSAGATISYTIILFGEAFQSHLPLALGLFWFFGIFLIALLLFSSTLGKGSMTGLLLTGGVLAFLLAMNIFPVLQSYNPMTLASLPMAILTGSKEPVDAWSPVITTLLLTYGCLHGAMGIFYRKSL